ncbi:MAG: glycosyltransferase [Flavobacteriales bacterium]|jgi:cellulose synthase/poly-beta-1,6-N-acetylglucosamine synthase-like glycosyltransferase|nr:glycosyltransferase [Flavobacteriales bacterium]
MAYLVFGLYFLFLLFIFLYSVVAFYLTILYLRSKSKPKKQGNLSILLENNYPKITVQLPVYNEMYVIERLIDAVCQFNYPSDKLEIQVLDDSNDETVVIIANKVAEWQTKGVDIQYIRREDRKGFKAGALDYGLKQCKGEFIAIFDADFVPDSDFLMKTIFPFVKNEKIGVVQTRWGHLNQNYSLLTRLQAFALNAHFRVEQVGRNKGKHFINFNGTAGIWRKKCIEDAGGWSADTLTEDLDLSYRAQLKGWVFKYIEKVVVPAELPIDMAGLKNQQFRWSKGAAECTRKNLGKVLSSSDLSLWTKFTAVFHLMNSSVYIVIAGLIVLSVPLVKIGMEDPRYASYYPYFGFFLINTFFLGFMYFIATKDEDKNTAVEFLKFIIFFPVFLTTMLGLTTYNFIAVLEGYLGIKSPFVRTPKYNLKSTEEKWSIKQYAKTFISPLLFIDLGVIAYAILGITLSYQSGNLSMLLFLVMVVCGFSYTLLLSLKHSFR